MIENGWLWSAHSPSAHNPMKIRQIEIRNFTKEAKMKRARAEISLGRLQNKRNAGNVPIGTSAIAQKNSIEVTGALHPTVYITMRFFLAFAVAVAPVAVAYAPAPFLQRQPSLSTHNSQLSKTQLNMVFQTDKPSNMFDGPRALVKERDACGVGFIANTQSGGTNILV
jgi:hypothetical protein